MEISDNNLFLNNTFSVDLNSNVVSKFIENGFYLKDYAEPE